MVLTFFSCSKHVKTDLQWIVTTLRCIIFSSYIYIWQDQVAKIITSKVYIYICIFFTIIITPLASLSFHPVLQKSHLQTEGIPWYTHPHSCLVFLFCCHSMYYQPPPRPLVLPWIYYKMETIGLILFISPLSSWIWFFLCMEKHLCYTILKYGKDCHDV